MCLIKRSWIPKFASKDILVYKLVEVTPEGVKTYFTNDSIPSDGILKAKDSFVNFLLNKYLRNEGVHSLSSFDYHGILVKAYIPKRTFYFEDPMCGEICSRKLRVTKELVNPEFYIRKRDVYRIPRADEGPEIPVTIPNTDIFVKVKDMLSKGYSAKYIKEKLNL